MKEIIVAFSLLSSVSATFAQGAIGFYNNPNTLISAGVPGQNTLISGARGSYYFGLLIAPLGTTDLVQFAFTGVYATNDDTRPGRIGPGQYVPPVPGWPYMSTKSFLVAGWSASLGHEWNPQWMSGVFNAAGYFGFSNIGTLNSGPPPGAPIGQPIFPLFGGTGATGFDLAPVAPQTSLSASISGGSIVISWTPSGSTLESSAVLGLGATWSTVGTQTPTNVPISSGAKFFRIRP